jgi:hypothetical protein
MFRNSSLEGKQIWYFTAPASLPISSIGQMSLNDITTSKAILNHKGTEYGFIRDLAEDMTYTKIMVPLSPGDAYRTGMTSSYGTGFLLKLTLPSKEAHRSNIPSPANCEIARRTRL